MCARVHLLKIFCALLHRTVLINDNESHITHSNYCRYVAILCRETRSQVITIIYSFAGYSSRFYCLN
jgi:hypothetical protein